MKRLLPALAVLAAAIFCLQTGPRAQAFPKPSINRISWELDFTHSTPSRISVRVPGSDSPKAYWYMPFTVTNNTNDEQDFLPIFDMVDDKGNVHHSDQNIPKEVFEAIKRREGKKLLEPLSKVSGRLLAGPDQARDSVAIWPEPLDRMGTFSIFVTGLSGEAVWLKDDKATPLSKADWTKIKPEDAGTILRKTLEIQIQVPGDEFYQGHDPVINKGERWVMR
jgi:hypothetical protein